MRLNDYTLCMAFGEMPCYLWMEGMDKEVYYVDEQTCDYHLFGGADVRPNQWQSAMKPEANKSLVCW